MGARVTAFAAMFFVAAVALHTITAQTGSPQHVTAANAVKFTPMDPKQPNGMRVSVVSGRLEGPGPVVFFVKLPKGRAPQHKHTSSYHATVISGQAKHWPAGGEAKAQVLGPGSHWFQPGNAPHGDECLSNECLFIARYEGPLDNVEVPEK